MTALLPLDSCPDTCGEQHYTPVCPVCAEYPDFCQGHGEIGDPAGHAILDKHDNDDHTDCHPNVECEL